MGEDTVQGDNNQGFHLSVTDDGTAIGRYGRGREGDGNLLGILDNLKLLLLIE